MSRLGLQVVVKSFYSPIPDLGALPRDVWERRSDLPGIELDLDGQLSFLERVLGPHVREFRPAHERAGDHGFHLDNPSYGPGDAETLFAWVRHARPRRVVEVGSGFTTLVIAEAARRNAADGHAPEVRVFDPYPGVAGPGTPGVTEFHREPAQQIPLDVFTALERDDILVVDTTHTVKVGGDVNRIVLDVLPRLGAGVLVHFHDIFLPYEYPRAWPERYGLYWSEQYLLQAFLALNRDFRIELALHALTRVHRDRVAAVIPSLAAGGAPAAFWIRRGYG
jgi:hypothetical protein